MSHLNREKPLIEAQDVAKSFNTQAGSVELFRNLDVRIMPGESLAIIGRSGAGKSTLLSLLAGLDTPTEGQILFDDQPLEQLDDAARADLRLQQISFIFQSFHLLPELDALDNVRLPLEIQGRKDADAQARHWLQQVGLGARLDHYPAQLSGGEQQRVAIARAFATEPKVLFADEPTGNLDDDTGQQIIEQLFDLNTNAGTTLILITHDIDLASRCQRRLHLQNGRLEEVPA
ncbi:putative ABC transport system ATP-binding protein [Marinobacterium halophilum]|uniref:Putative ABC transport system ATP-binding protein n=1 Tax=Marinobacterium halophilum TaxID=267374 RepID=A0A2P8EY57_9GAMM|nr:ABC transporter ATP-binding protein [Marinobacterium halophilum]PSL14400.1 putative ABC transport system ATP-binding protein [Marinobacterium halophilum]